MNCAGCCVEEPGLGRARRASLLRSQLQQPQQPRIFCPQLLYLALQRRQFGIQGLGLHTFHPPPSQRSSVRNHRLATGDGVRAHCGQAGNCLRKHPVTTSCSAEQLPQHCVGPWGYRFVRVEICAYLERGFGRFYADHAHEQPQVINVTCPGRQCLHGEYMLRRGGHHPQPG